jgi:glutamate--cysteine ligase
MPSIHRVLSEKDVHEHIERTCFVRSEQARVGIEMEWLVYSSSDPRIPGPYEQVLEILQGLSELPATGAISFEPGGQLELSSRALNGVDNACDEAATDRGFLQNLLRDYGIDVLSVGMDPLRRNERVVFTPRYDRMEECFDSFGQFGRRMMRDTAAIQVNVDCSSRVSDQFRVAQRLGPAMAAAFANSPIVDGAPNGTASNRLAVWNHMDPSRTLPVGVSSDPADAWSEYALGAQLMLIRIDEANYLPVTEPFSLRRWIERGHAAGFPTVEDLDYHLTTLFPPVRPKGWLEIRMLDALPDPWWRAAVTAWFVLLNDRDAGEMAEQMSFGTWDLWKEAASSGLSHPELARAAKSCMSLALEGAARLKVEARNLAALSEFAERYTIRGRMPADDLIDSFEKTGSFGGGPEMEEAWT